MLLFVSIYSLSVFVVLRVLPISSVAFLTLKLQPDLFFGLDYYYFVIARGCTCPFCCHIIHFLSF